MPESFPEQILAGINRKVEVQEDQVGGRYSDKSVSFLQELKGQHDVLDDVNVEVGPVAQNQVQEIGVARIVFDEQHLRRLLYPVLSVIHVMSPACGYTWCVRSDGSDTVLT